MNLIHRYAVKYLSEFRKEVKEGKKTHIDPDFQLLINTVNKVCYKQNLPLMLEAAQIALDLFEPKHLDKVKIFKIDRSKLMMVRAIDFESSLDVFKQQLRAEIFGA